MNINILSAKKIALIIKDENHHKIFVEDLIASFPKMDIYIFREKTDTLNENINTPKKRKLKDKYSIKNLAYYIHNKGLYRCIKKGIAFSAKKVFKKKQTDRFDYFEKQLNFECKKLFPNLSNQKEYHLLNHTELLNDYDVVITFENVLSENITKNLRAIVINLHPGGMYFYENQAILKALYHKLDREIEVNINTIKSKNIPPVIIKTSYPTLVISDNPEMVYLRTFKLGIELLKNILTDLIKNKSIDYIKEYNQCFMQQTIDYEKIELLYKEFENSFMEFLLKNIRKH